MKRQLSGFLILCVLIGLNGCLSKSYKHVRRHSIQVQPQHADVSVNGTETLRVRSFSAASSFESPYFVYRIATNEYETDHYNQFTTTPDTLMTEQVMRWFSSSPLYKHVIDARAYVPSQYLITGRLLELYGDYRDEKAPQAIVAIEFTVLQEGKTKSKMLMQKTYEDSTAMSDLSVASLVRGWEVALSRILENLEKDVATQRLYIKRAPLDDQKKKSTAHSPETKDQNGAP